MKKLTLLCLILLSSNQVFAAAATVLSTSNKVSSGQRALSRGSALNVGDSIITGADSQANIKYTNGTLVNIGSDSNYKILAYAPKEAEVQISAELSYGKINSKTTGKSKEALKTPVIALAILGTEYELAVNCKKKIDEHTRTDCKDLNLHVIEGSVMAGGTVVTAGQSIQATPSGIKPAPFPPSMQVNSASSASSSSDSGASGTASYSQVVGSQTATVNSTGVVVGTSWQSTGGIPCSGCACPPGCLLPLTPGRY